MISIKRSLIHVLSRIGCFLLNLKGITTGKGVILSGMPCIKKYPGSVISIGHGVTLHSMRRLNPGLSGKTTLAALSDKATLTLDDGCGVSGVKMLCVNSIYIGKNTLIGADAFIIDNDMHYPAGASQWGSTLGHPEYGQPIHIGEGCFIGTRAIILKGVSIGNGSVVAAGALVTRDVPPNHLAIGNPAVNKPLPQRLRHSEAG